MDDPAVSGLGSSSKSPATARRGRVVDAALTLILALAAAGAGFCVQEAHLFHRRPAVEQINMMGHIYTDASERTRAAAALFELRGDMGTFGAVLGLAMGLAGGWVARSWRGALFAASLGMAACAAAGIVAVSIAVPIYERAEAASAGDLTRSILLHLALWAPLGAAAGGAHAMGWQRGRAASIAARCAAGVVAGSLGVALGAILYDLTGAFAFPLAETGKPLAAEALPRLLAFLLVALGTALGLVLSTHRAQAFPKG